MRPLIIIGASGRYCPPGVAELIRTRLARHLANVGGRVGVYFEDDSRDASAILESGAGDAVIAYAPGVFADAITRQPVRIFADGPQVILTTGGDPKDWKETDDPRQFLEGVAAVLRAPVLNVENDAALGALVRLLNGKPLVTA